MRANCGDRINELMDKERWDQARPLIEQELTKELDNHWLLAQLGATYYEQRHYRKALEVLLRSRDVLADCPLTLWHLAGTLDALGDHRGGVRIYTWLLESQKTAEDDPCWESAEWTDALETDCVFRLGLCFERLHATAKAERCFRQYVDLVLAGAEGSYPVAEVVRHLRNNGRGQRKAIENELQEFAGWLQR